MKQRAAEQLAQAPSMQVPQAPSMQVPQEPEPLVPEVPVQLVPLRTPKDRTAARSALVATMPEQLEERRAARWLLATARLFASFEDYQIRFTINFPSRVENARRQAK